MIVFNGFNNHAINSNKSTSKLHNILRTYSSSGYGVHAWKLSGLDYLILLSQGRLGLDYGGRGRVKNAEKMIT